MHSLDEADAPAPGNTQAAAAATADDGECVIVGSVNEGAVAALTQALNAVMEKYDLNPKQLAVTHAAIPQPQPQPLYLLYAVTALTVVTVGCR